MKANSLLKLLFIALISFGAISCKDDEETDPVIEEPENPNIAVNTWIQAVMDEVYLWLEDMNSPIANTSDPEDYFEALLNRPTDRFSVIYADYQELINSLNGITLEAGYEFSLYRQGSEGTNVIALITYTKKGSPAETAGLKRGDYIYKINGTQITVDNYRTLLDVIDEPHSISYARYSEGSGSYVDQGDLTLATTQITENPIYLDSVYTINGEKIGYFVYNFFSPGTGSTSTTYDDQMDEIFAKFKSEGIKHLVLDFRYNGGGYVSSAVNLASLIGPGVGTTDIFYKTKYNSYLMQFDELKNVQTPFLEKSANLGATLSNNRVYILTSSRTASASELVINGLKPYMDIFLIGDVTTGKNVGSIPFEDEENAENTYGILPIVSRSFNSLDQSDYTDGFDPDIEASEASEYLRPLGDVNDVLFRAAIEQITGIPSGARVQKINRVEVGSSLDQKLRFGLQIEHNDLVKEQITNAIQARIKSN